MGTVSGLFCFIIFHFIQHHFSYRKQNKLGTPGSSFPALGRRGASATLSSGENRFIFKRRLFKSNRELSQDPVEVNLLYAQAVHSVVKVCLIFRHHHLDVFTCLLY